MERLGALYHWSPVDRRKQIVRKGLVPGSRLTVTSSSIDPTTDEEWRQPHVCLSPTPSMAWALSGDQPRLSHILEWDLWQVSLIEEDEIHIRPLWGTKIEEVQVRNRIPKSRLWHVATRIR